MDLGRVLDDDDSTALIVWCDALSFVIERERERMCIFASGARCQCMNARWMTRRLVESFFFWGERVIRFLYRFRFHFFIGANSFLCFRTRIEMSLNFRLLSKIEEDVPFPAGVDHQDCLSTGFFNSLGWLVQESVSIKWRKTRKVNSFPGNQRSTTADDWMAARLNERFRWTVVNRQAW